MATENRLKPCLLAREISAEGANHSSLAQRAMTIARIRSRAEGPSHNFGPGFQPLNNCFPQPGALRQAGMNRAFGPSA
jgi:hypothetical protein